MASVNSCLWQNGIVKSVVMLLLTRGRLQYHRRFALNAGPREALGKTNFIKDKHSSSFMVLVELFVSPNCPHCPAAKLAVAKARKKFKDGEIIFKRYRTTTPEGKAKASKYNLLGVPAVFVDGDMVRGEITEEKVVDMIERKLNPKKSFFSKIFGN